MGSIPNVGVNINNRSTLPSDKVLLFKILKYFVFSVMTFIVVISDNVEND